MNEFEKAFAMANEFASAARQLDTLRKAEQSLPSLPFRFAALHAIELYFNAFLMFKGIEAAEVKKLNHDFAERLRLATQFGLVMRKKTTVNLHAIYRLREYTRSRYDPDIAEENLSIPQLNSVLLETRKKVTDQISMKTEAPSKKAAIG